MLGHSWSIAGRLLTRLVGIDRCVQISAQVRRPLSPPISATLNITRRCNSRCCYCLSWQIHDAPEPSLAEIKGVLNSLAHIGLQRVAFSGGEPLVRRDLEEMVAYAHSRGLWVNVLSNGLLATEKRVTALVEAGMDYLTLSIDSANPEVYRSLRGVPFEAFEERLSDCMRVRDRSSPLQLGVHSVICRQNLESLPDLVRYLDEREIFISFQAIHPVFNVGGQQVQDDMQFRPRDRPDLERLISKLLALKSQGLRVSASRYYLEHLAAYAAEHQMPPDHRCAAGYSTLAIDNLLNLYACWPLPPIGDLRQARLESYWFSRAYQRRREQMWRMDCPGCWLSCHAEKGADARRRELRDQMRHRTSERR